MARVARLFAALEGALAGAADASLAPGMAAYQRNQFPFLGIRTPERRAAQKAAGVLAGARGITEAELVQFVDECWAQPEREYQYAAVDVLRKEQAVLTAASLPAVRGWITTKSWWDTVDFLAPHVVGPLVQRHPHLAATMDAWAANDNIWVARAAILHQLFFRAATDEGRLFRYCTLRGGDSEFFIRKALGWALRQHGRVAPDAVRQFVAAHEAALSRLTKREALKHLQ